MSSTCLFSISLNCPIVIKNEWKGLGVSFFLVAHGAFLGRMCLRPQEPQQVKLRHVVQGVYVLRDKPQTQSSVSPGELEAGVRSWKACWDCMTSQIDVFVCCCWCSAGPFQKKNNNKVWTERKPNLLNVSRLQTPDAFEKEKLYLGIRQSWRLTAVEELIIHRLCRYSFWTEGNRSRTQNPEPNK